MAVDVGMERLLGGLHPEELQKICDGQIQYYSFLGLPEGAYKDYLKTSS